MPPFWKDWTERVAWTAAEAAVGVVAVEVGELNYVWVPVVATGLAMVKGWLASMIGDPDSAGTVV